MGDSALQGCGEMPASRQRLKLPLRGWSLRPPWSLLLIAADRHPHQKQVKKHVYFFLSPCSVHPQGPALSEPYEKWSSKGDGQTLCRLEHCGSEETPALKWAPENRALSRQGWSRTDLHDAGKWSTCFQSTSVEESSENLAARSTMSVWFLLSSSLLCPNV